MRKRECWDRIKRNEAQDERRGWRSIKRRGMQGNKEEVGSPKQGEE